MDKVLTIATTAAYKLSESISERWPVLTASPLREVYISRTCRRFVWIKFS